MKYSKEQLDAARRGVKRAQTYSPGGFGGVLKKFGRKAVGKVAKRVKISHFQDYKGKAGNLTRKLRNPFTVKAPGGKTPRYTK